MAGGQDTRRGETMKLRLTLWSFFVAASLAAMGCAGIHSHNLPPADRLLAPGPGVDGPGPGVLMPAMPPTLPMAGAVMEQQTIQMLFDRPEGMQIRWDVSGVGQFDSDPLILPGRKNFPS